MAFEYRFNVIRFYSKLNRFVLSLRKKPNHFVLKIRPGGFADYTQEKCYGDKSFHTIVFVEAKIGKITSMDVFPYKFLYALRIFLRIIPVRHGVCRPGYNPQLFRFALGLVQGIDHPSGHVCIRISMYE